MANGIGGLLSEGNPLLDIGLGLLAQSGPVRGPAPSFGQTLGRAGQFAFARNRERLRNDLIRSRLAEDQRRREAVGQLQGLLGQETTIQGPGTAVTGLEGEEIGTIPGRQAMVPLLATPEGQSQLMGLLGQVAPETVATSLLSQQTERAEPADLRMFREFFPDVDPGTPEGRQQFLEFKKAQTGNEQQALQLDIMKRQLEVEKLVNELRSEREEEQQSEANFADAVRSDVSDAKRLLQLNERLADSLGETGVPLPNMRRAILSGTSAVRRLFGGDTQKADQVIADFDTFNKIANRFALETAERLNTRGALTNFQLQSIQNTVPSLSLSPTANRRIVADQLESLISAADRNDVPLPNRGEIESLIEQIRSEDTAQQPGVRPARQPTRRQRRVIDFEELPET